MILKTNTVTIEAIKQAAADRVPPDIEMLLNTKQRRSEDLYEEFKLLTIHDDKAVAKLSHS